MGTKIDGSPPRLPERIWMANDLYHYVEGVLTTERHHDTFSSAPGYMVVDLDDYLALESTERRLRAALEFLMEVTEPPERNCSCHLNPPCGDCVDYGGVREAHELARAALKGDDDVANDKPLLK